MTDHQYHRSSSTPPSLVWFRHDLRLSDNPALAAAVARGGPVVCLYVLDDETPGKWAHGSASRWWLHHGLQVLSEDLKALGSRLFLYRGRGGDVIADLAQAWGAGAVYWNRSYAPFDREPDSALKAALTAQGIDAQSFNGNLISEPVRVRNKTGGVFKVFTPYWKTISAHPVDPPIPAPRTLPSPPSLPAKTAPLDLRDLSLLPTVPDWSAGLQASWTPGEAGAQARFEAFVASQGGLADYAEGRNRPDLDACSRLSPFLKFGHISPRQVWHWTLHAMAASPALEQSGWAFLREIGWREFSYYLLHHFPTLPSHNWRPEFDAFPWNQDREGYDAWCKGQTGYPMVDAGMRQLWKTGWMHNRVRMITGSFLVKHQLLPWQMGERWFWDTLVDADIASNSAGWQWVAGCGADASPYFRVFNPITQGPKFDPEARFIRSFVPELADLDDKSLFEPWNADLLLLQAGGVTLGQTYPRPIVDHPAARARALAAYETVKRSNTSPPPSASSSPSSPSSSKAEKAKAA